MTEEDWRGGLAPHYDYMLPGKPDDPDMRESASIWLYEENGAFGFPRVGLEAVGAVWENHRYDMHCVFADGRALIESAASGPTHSPMAADGKARILGAGGLKFECLEPYRKWRVSYTGDAVDTTSAAMLANTVDRNRLVPVSWEVVIDMVTPCWVQDNTAEKLVGLSQRELDDAKSMGLGYRMEHLFRGQGELTIGGESQTFRNNGSRIHRQSVRPLDGFRGHCWQSAVFPDGRAFGYITYPPAPDGSTYNEGYIYQDGKMYPAVASKIPWIDTPPPMGEDVSLELTSELGVTRIAATSCIATFKAGIAEMPGFLLSQAGARYDWDGQVAWGMMERSVMKGV